MNDPTEGGRTYYVSTEDCELSVGGWCLFHSTGRGPIYCRPLGFTEFAEDHTPDALKSV